MGPERRHERGLLGPQSVAWSVIGHPGSLVGGLRALMIQSLHPLAMAGVAQHSDYRMRALDRLRRTAYYVTATVFGDLATARAAAERVRTIHRRVRGFDPVTGRAYSADDPDTQVWVHSVEWHSFLAAYRAFAPTLAASEEDCYISEGVAIAELVGTPRELVPHSVAAMHAYFEGVRSELRVSSDSRDAIDFVLHPPLTRELLAVQVPLRIFSNAALALVPRDLRRLADVDRPRALDVVALAAARPLVGSMVLPGVRDVAALVLGGEVRRVREQALGAYGQATPASLGRERAAA
ncbi:MAG: DUF2236 domain-containing protein [Actinobacteria bacterium]|nr:MAG: DUF2236 domain-containing protein [Actinomycetota bacterium]